MKATAIAPSNIAFIKYFGRIDEELRLPTNGSMSMNLSNLLTTTTVEFDEGLKEDEVTISNKRLMIQDSGFRRVTNHVNLIRRFAEIKTYAKVVSENNFPASTGLSSSASGFAALTLAVTKALRLDLSEKELSILARQGSGSACRSIPDGFVEWHAGSSSETSYAKSIFPPDYWDILDVVVILSSQKKKITTSHGQTYIHKSPMFHARLTRIETKIARMKQYLKEKDFEKFGALMEEEAEELHEVMRAITPPLDYLFPKTKALIESVKAWRMSGIPVYWTVNTGHNVHVLIEGKNIKDLLLKLEPLFSPEQLIVNKPARGASLSTNHLF